MISFLKNLFKKPKLRVHVQAPTVPQAFEFPEPEFNKLTNELSFQMDPHDTVGSFANFISSPAFAKYKLDVQIPNHALILGYAYCTAVILKKHLHTQEAVNKVLDAFYNHPNPSIDKEKVKGRYDIN